MKKMMKTILTSLWLLAAVALAGGCSEEPAAAESGEGQTEITVTAAGGVETLAAAAIQSRAQRELPTTCIPDANSFSLEITQNGTLVSSYETMQSYNQPLMTAGAYKATITYGNPNSEGASAYYFTGTTDFTVIARKTSQVTVTASLANSAVSLATTDYFNKYYTSATLTLETESGYKQAFSVSNQSGPTGATPIFVKSATKLFLSGKATKTNGVNVEFPRTEIGSTTARTWHSVSVDMSQASQLSIQVSLDDTPTEIDEQTVELNPEA